MSTIMSLTDFFPIYIFGQIVLKTTYCSMHFFSVCKIEMAWRGMEL